MDKIISRKIAKERNLKFYFNGNPCVFGHICQRYTSSFGCTICAAEHRESRKEIQKKFNKEYRENNRDKCIKYSREYNQNNKDVLKEKRQTKEYKDRANSYMKDRRKNDILFKIAFLLRTRLNSAIYGNYKKGSAVKDLGCSIEFLKEYLELKFQEGMSWENHGRGDDCWHIDHKKPLASFDLTDRQQLLQACHYTNLQPLWSFDNLSKRDKYFE